MGGSRVSYIGLFGRRDFRLLYVGQSISRVGDGMAEIVINWTVYSLTGSPLMLALSLLLQSLPPVLFSLVGGTAADRYPRKWVMIVSDAARALVTIAAAALGRLGLLNEWGLMACGFLLVSAASFFAPARVALVPEIVGEDELDAANGLLVGSFHAAGLISPALGGALLLVTSPALILFIDALTFLVSIATLVPLRAARARPRTGRRSALAELRSGFEAMRLNAALLVVVASFGAGTMLAGGVDKLGLPLLMSALGAGSAGYGLMSSVFGVGMLAGSFAMGKLGVRSRYRAVMSGWLVEGLLLIALGSSPGLPFALAVAVLLGLNNNVINLPTMSLIQTGAGAENAGKVYAFWNVSIWAGVSLSYVVFGPIFNAVSFRAVYAGAGLLLAGLAALGLAAGRRIGEERRAPAAVGGVRA